MLHKSRYYESCEIKYHSFLYVKFNFIFILPFASCSLKVIRILIHFHEKVRNFFRKDSFNEPVPEKTLQRLFTVELAYVLSTILSAARQNI